MAAAGRPASTPSSSPPRSSGTGAGEILLTSMDRDGTRSGFDLALTRAVVDAVGVPVIASGGVGTLDHLVEGVTEGGASAVLAASIFHFGELHHRRGQGGDGRGRHSREARHERARPPRRHHRGAPRRRPRGSWTAALLASGPGKCAEKFGEEAVEAIVAAASGTARG